jgi:selenocysteine-specific translation elongation factor
MAVKRSITAAVLCDLDLAGRIAKKGGETDLTIFDHKKGDFVLSLVVPHRFPEKLPPLLLALGMADTVVLSAREMSRPLGEAVVAADYFHFPRGIIYAPGPVSPEQLGPVLKGTTLERFPIVTSHFEVADFLMDPELRPRKLEGTVVLVDQSFEVKGVGTVILGKVAAGPVKVHQKLKILPSGGEAQVRSIQIHDDDHAEGPVGVRVGLALRNADVSEVSRGAVLVDGVLPEVVDRVEGEFRVNRFFKPAPAAGMAVHALSGLQDVAGKIEEVGAGRARLSLERPLVRLKGMPVVVASLDAPGSKIVGAFA